MGRQVIVIPFPHKCPEVKDEHLMLVEFPGKNTGDQIFSVARNLFVPHSATGASKKTTVGGYQVSLVGSYDQLVTTVDWASFSLAGDFSARMADLKRQFGKGYGFVVAEPRLNKKDGGMGGVFGWVWYGDQAILPGTCEPSGNRTGYIFNDCTKDIVRSDKTQSLGEDQWQSATFHNDVVLELQVLLETGYMFHASNPLSRKALSIAGSIMDGAIIHLSDLPIHNGHIISIPGTPFLQPVKERPPSPPSSKRPSYWIIGLLLAILIVLIAAVVKFSR